MTFTSGSKLIGMVNIIASMLKSIQIVPGFSLFQALQLAIMIALAAMVAGMFIRRMSD